MSKQVKTRWLNTRTDEEQGARVDAYLAAGNKTLGELMRDALNTYMALYPIEPKAPEKIKPTKEK